MAQPRPTTRTAKIANVQKGTAKSAHSVGLSVPTPPTTLIKTQAPTTGRATMKRKAAASSRRTPLWSQDRIRKAGSNYKVRAARPAQRRAGGFSIENRGGSYSELVVFGFFSGGPEEMRRIRGTSADLMERWWFIERGELPPADYGHLIPTTDEELREEFGAWDRTELAFHREEVDELREEKRSQVAAILQAIGDLEDQIAASQDPDEVAELSRERRALQGRKREVDELAESEENWKALRYKDRREDQWQDLLRRQQLEIARAEDKVLELQQRLHQEIQAECDRWFQTDVFELERWNLS